MAELIPFSLKDTPALIETIFPAQKVSFEAQFERKSVQSQTITGVGSYWKGRKPLILVRAIVLGSLLPPTDDAEKDLEIYEQLMAFDEGGLTRRALVNNAFSPKEITRTLALSNPWHYFVCPFKEEELTPEEALLWEMPFDTDKLGVNLRWQRNLPDSDKLDLYLQMLQTLPNYEARAALCKRPEELDQTELYAPVWPRVNAHYQHLGIKASSHHELVEQLGLLRFGHRPKVGDTFCGGGSIPFEAARLGCDVYASDLNPIACMLTWGALNIVGASPEKRIEIEDAQNQIVAAADKEITELGIEHDSQGNRAKAYLYCLETRCPETGWMVPLSPSWVISKTRNVVAKLTPNPKHQRFDIDIVSGVSAEELQQAELGTLQNGCLTYSLNGKTYTTPIKTLRGDFKDADGNNINRLRAWKKHDFRPSPDDIFQERLYCIQWISAYSKVKKQNDTFFATVTEQDLERERQVEQIVAENITQWQQQCLIPDMVIEPGDKTDEPIRTRGWMYWHHLFNARQLLVGSIVKKHINEMPDVIQPILFLSLAKMVDWSSKLCRYGTGAARESIAQTFYNQAFNTNYFYGVRSFVTGRNYISLSDSSSVIHGNSSIQNLSVSEVNVSCDYWITDPPYADAVNYHEISDFFIAWLRKNPPAPFDKWIWDSRRALAIKGSGDDFRRGMVEAYTAMTQQMPDNGMQCVMFTHQDTGVWSDMVGIFWAAGLQVVAAWYIATETTSELKKGGYVQGTVILMLRKRELGEKPGFKQKILPAVRREVEAQITQMMHLNADVTNKRRTGSLPVSALPASLRVVGEPVFNDSDLQMAGYAAALKVLTAYTQIGGEDVTTFALRPRIKGEITVVDEIVQQAAEAANSLLIPEGLGAETWQKISGIQRFYLRMMDMETTGASKLDNYQNFAKAFRVEDYTRVMGNMAANKARLKRVTEFASRELTESTELGASWLGYLVIGLQQLLAEVEPQAVISQIQADLPEFMEVRPLLIDMLLFIGKKAPEPQVKEVAEILAARLRNMRAIGQ